MQSLKRSVRAPISVHSLNDFGEIWEVLAVCQAGPLQLGPLASEAASVKCLSDFDSCVVKINHLLSTVGFFSCSL